MPVPAARRPALTCRHCGATLTALQRLRGEHCERGECRHRATVARLRAQRDADLAATRAAAARRDATEPAAHAPVVWLAAHSARLVPLPAARRRAHREHLESLAAAIEGGTDAGAMAAAPPVDDETPPAASAAAALCAFCAGRCCRHGARKHAFVTAELLRRWLAANPGRRPADAVASYTALLPRHHVEDSCVYHGRDGCTLPRALRSDICNHFACDALQQVQRAAAAEPPQTTLLAAMEHTWQLRGVAVLQPEGFRRVTLKRRRRAGGSPA